MIKINYSLPRLNKLHFTSEFQDKIKTAQFTISRTSQKKIKLISSFQFF